MMLKKLRYKNPYHNHHYDYTDDIKRIISVFNERGYEMSVDLAVQVWEAVSDNYAAGWLTLRAYTDDEIFKDAMEYLEEVND
jgi:hypothetical protein